MASGNLIFFCDSDDFIDSKTIETMLVKLIKDHADIVACGISKVYSKDLNNDATEERFTDSVSGRWSGKDSVIQMMCANNICSAAWNKLYKEELFDGIRFPLGMQNEDEATTYKLLYRARYVSYIPETFYKYYQREGSIVHSGIKSVYHFFLKALKDRIDFFEEKNEVELKQYSRIAYLELIKFSYRNIEDKTIRKELSDIYGNSISVSDLPSVAGIRKKAALLLWKYLKY
jgi:hypothetical protein